MSNVSQELIEKIARVTHEANRAWCVANGDLSQPTWDEAPDWQRKSAVQGAEFAINNPDATDEDSHTDWCAVKYNDGWEWGEVKDEDAKTHPCLVPYEQLPFVQRAKDAIFRSIVLAVVNSL